MANPFTPKTQKALKVVGRLIREWSQGNTPPEAVADGDRFVFQRNDFERLLDAELGPEDYEIRGDVRTIELITRRPDCFTLVLPEPYAVVDLNAGDTTTVEIPEIYGTVNPNYAKALDPATKATRTVPLDKANYEDFLDPYMAGYCCTQCQ